MWVTISPVGEGKGVRVGRRGNAENPFSRFWFSSAYLCASASLRWVLLLLLSATASAAGQKPYYAKVISVIDGDTVMVEHAKHRTTIRLASIDAPERTQAYGDVSREALTARVLRKDVYVQPKVIDEYGRTVATLELNGVDINREQVRKGYAWEYSFHHADHAMVALQNEARAARRGLWAEANPQPPWEYRKTHHTPPPVNKQGATPGSKLSRDAIRPACGKKHYCSQMVTCEEARFYLTQCKVATLDKDGDGTPCESLCAPGAK